MIKLSFNLPTDTVEVLRKLAAIETLRRAITNEKFFDKVISAPVERFSLSSRVVACDK